MSTHQCMVDAGSDEGKISQFFVAVRAKKTRPARLPLHELALAGAPCWWWAGCGPAPCPHAVCPALREHLAHALLEAEGELRDLSRPLRGAGIGPLSPSLATASCVTKPAVQGMGGRHLQGQCKGHTSGQTVENCSPLRGGKGNSGDQPHKRAYPRWLADDGVSQGDFSWNKQKTSSNGLSFERRNRPGLHHHWS